MHVVTPEQAIAQTRLWLEKAVIGLNLCPFAKSVYVKEQVRYRYSEAATPDALLEHLISELNLLHRTAAKEIDTTLLIHPHVLGDFLDYNDFLEVADCALAELGLESIVQIASFHPAYRFAGTPDNDITNYTNRSPYPILHLLRESSVSRAVADYPDTDRIFEENIQKLERIGLEGWRAMWPLRP
jgi:hypothetical protein